VSAPQFDRHDPSAVRVAIRAGDWTAPTAGLAPGRVQANLVVLPQRDAYDFLRFCVANPRPCPVLEVTEAGSPEPVHSAPGADLRSDVPGYRIFREGELVDEVHDIRAMWRDDLVAFLIGCSFTFERALLAAGLPVRHVEEGVNVPMYRTSPFAAAQALRAVQVTSRYPAVHGAPVHLGDPEAIGIRALDRPDYGDPVTIRDGEVPVFWACGVTPQAAAAAARPELMITHAPGHMFVTDLLDDQQAVL
jgi:uncharacterized protein YcsI (UPF0317 family)